jgi:hypothetical protein
MLSEGAISIWHNQCGWINFTRDKRSLSKSRGTIWTRRSDEKKIRWMIKNLPRNGAAIALIDAHRANHPNQLVIRDRFLDPKFRF